MSGFDQLEQELRAAQHRQRAGGRVLVRALPLVPVVALVATAAVFIGALTVLKPHSNHPAPHHANLTGGPSPASSGPPAPLHLSRTDRRVFNDVTKAEGTAARRDQACLPEIAGLGDPGRKPDLSSGAPSEATLSTLGTLARPPRSSDRLPPRIIGAPPSRAVYPFGTYPPMKGIYARYIRKARHRFGANYYLVPAADANTLSPVPDRCYAEQRSALRQELPTIPASLRQAALTLQARYIAYQRASLLPYPGVCLDAINDTGNGDGCSNGYSLSEIEAGDTLTSGAPAGAPVVYGLAPTGVRSVTLYYPRRKPQTVLAINNVFILHNPRQKLPHDGLPDKLVWRGPAGQLIKTISPR
jgi:hypothetical protein